jgi:predicted O-methyltransferase YrrM
MNKKISSPAELMNSIFAFREARIILTAFELEIFSVLGSNSKSSKEISGIIKTNERATDRLLNALVAIGLLIKENEKFSNTDFSLKHLVKYNPGFLGGITHSVHLWKSWSTLTDAVKTGTSVMNREPVNDRDNLWLEGFISAMHMRAKQSQAPGIAKLLNFKGVKKILDIGGGSGVFSFAMITLNPELKATIFDLPNVIKLTKLYIEKEGFKNKVGTVEGDYLKDELGTDYDLLFLSAIIHSNSHEENKLLFKKCFSALNKNGQLVIMDNIMDNERTSPYSGALFALNMLVGTQSGDTYTEVEVVGWMKEAGFSDFSRLDTEFDNTLITGIKK